MSTSTESKLDKEVIQSRKVRRTKSDYIEATATAAAIANKVTIPFTDNLTLNANNGTTISNTAGWTTNVNIAGKSLTQGSLTQGSLTTNGSTITTIATPSIGYYGSSISTAAYPNLNVMSVSPAPTAKMNLMGRDFEIQMSLVSPGLLVTLIGYLGIDYYVYLKSIGFDFSGIDKDVLDHLDAVSKGHARTQKIKKALDTDARP